MVQQVNLLAIKPVPGTQKVEGKNRHIKNQIDLWMFVNNSNLKYKFKIEAVLKIHL